MFGCYWRRSLLYVSLIMLIKEILVFLPSKAELWTEQGRQVTRSFYHNQSIVTSVCDDIPYSIKHVLPKRGKFSDNHIFAGGLDFEPCKSTSAANAKYT